MDLVDDDRIDRAERMTGVRGQQQVERLWRRDQDVRRLTQEPGALDGRCVAGTDRDSGLMIGVSPRDRLVRDPGNRRAQVALNVDRQRLQWRDVKDATTTILCRNRIKHDPIDAPEEGGEGFAAARRGQDERGVAARDRWPPLGLRRSRAFERVAEPVGDGRLKERERLVSSSHEAILVVAR